MGPIIQLHREDRPKRFGIAKEKVDVLGGDPVERGGVGPTIEPVAQVSEADFREHEIALPRGQAERRVEGCLRWRQKRLNQLVRIRLRIFG
jgi:hypothetical protein